MNRHTALLTKTAELLIGLLIFLLPLFALPITPEYLNMNKAMLMTAVTLLLAILIGLRILAGGKVQFVKTPLNAIIWFFLGTMIISTIFSMDKTSSIFGGYGKWAPSVWFYTIVIIGFYCAQNTIDKNKIAYLRTLINLLILSTTINTIYILGSILLNKSLWGFGTFMGSLEDTFILTTAVLIIIVAKLTNTQSDMKSKLLLSLGYVVNTTLLVLGYGYYYVTIALLLVGLIYQISQIKHANKKRILILLATIIVIFIGNMNFVNKTIPQLKIIQEPKLTIKESWYIASSALKETPIFGTGPSTFYINFTRHKPQSLNNTFYWNLKFDKSSAEFLNIVIELGIVGLIIWLFFIKTILEKTVFVTVSEGDNEVGFIILTLVSALFMAPATILTTALLFVFLGIQTKILATTNQQNPKVEFIEMLIPSELETNKDNQGPRYILAILVLGVVMLISYMSYKNYTAEIYIKKALQSFGAHNTTAGMIYLGKALNSNPRRDVYQNLAAKAALDTAVEITKQTTVTDNQKETVQNLLSFAIEKSRISTELLNPLNSSGWETRALIYKTVKDNVKNGFELALQSYNVAKNLDPQNPIIRTNIGDLYVENKDAQNAVVSYAEALTIKPDYIPARYRLVRVYTQYGKYKEALEQLNIIKALVGENNELEDPINKEIEAIKNLESKAVESTASKK